MRLLFLNHNYRFGGTYYRAMPMAEQLARRGHQVTLLTVSREHCLRTAWSHVNGVHLGEMPNLGQDVSGQGYGPLDNLARCAHTLTHRYDVIHMLDHKPNASFAGFAGRWRGGRLVADWADWWGRPGGLNDVPLRRIPAVGRFEDWWEEKSKLWADGVVTISTVLRQRAIDLGYPPERTIYIPTGAPTDRVRPMAVSEARQRLGLPGGRQMVGFIGDGRTDLEIVMRALQHLPDVYLMIIGNKSLEVLDQARSFGVADRLWQTGFVLDEEVSLYLACSEVMVLPLVDRAANRGRLPNKILDYMAAGRPTVASPVGDVRAIVEGRKVGLLASSGNFADAIQRLLQDQSLREEQGRTARYVAETAFGWSHLIDQLEDFYDRVLGLGR